jgi:hypothetical protein
VTGVASVPAQVLERLADGRLAEYSAPGVRVEPDGQLEDEPFCLRATALIPRDGRYYARAARFARRLRSARGGVERRLRWP